MKRLPGIVQTIRRQHVEPVTTCTDLVPVDTTRCPMCDTPISPVGWGQPALFYFGGYGATTLHTIRRCGCGWQLPADEQATNPRG